MAVSEFILGILGNLLARHIDPAGKSLAESIVERLSRAGPGIPPNHDVEKACRQSLRQALGLLSQTLDLQISRPENLVEAFKNRFDTNGKWKPLIDWWHTDERGWFSAFLKAVDSDDALNDFKLPTITAASDLNQTMLSLDHEEWTRQFGVSLLKWTERNTPFEKRPSCFDLWAAQGWPITQDDSATRITLYQAWSLFLQDHFKTDEKVRAILTADWLASIDSRLTNESVGALELSSALTEPLEKHLAVLPSLLESVQALSSSVHGLGEQTGVLLGLMLEYGKDIASFRSSLEQSLQLGVSANTKLDTSLQNDQRIIELLEKLMPSASEAVIEPTVVAVSPTKKRIAHSKLLAAEGASRYERLVGRSREKSTLTRAWRQEGLNVLVFVAWGGVGKTSLITDWIAQLHAGKWQGVDAFFDWSFYSQGTRDQSSANSDLFFRTALHHFGEDALADSAASLEEKAARLADAVCRQRTLLVLDGIEPLQHPRKPGHEEGRLKDGGILTLLQRLADSDFSGLCLVTTRLPVIDLKRYIGSTVQESELNHLSVRHGAELLHLAGARYVGDSEIKADDEELRTAAVEMKGHAMTLQMLGGYLASAHEGDIRRRDCVDFTRVFADQLEGHAYNVMAAYEEWFQSEGTRGQRQLSVLRMLGLFDRVADAECIAALRKEGGIAGVSDAVADLTESEWTQTLHLLSKHRLAFSDRQTHAIDAHPLIREYFAKHLREKLAEGFKAAHSRLFDHLCVRTEHRPATLEGLQPLYQAVVHGCLAGRQQEALHKVYVERILRGTGHDGFYSRNQLGAIGADLGAVAAFFEEPWSRLSANLSAAAQAYLLNAAGFHLRALGRLTEAVEPMRVGMEMGVEAEDWAESARRASNLSELEVTLGRVEEAVADARRSIEFADRSGDAFIRMVNRTTAADALHQSGEREEARRLFEQAEALQRERQPQFELLYGVAGFRYCDLILAPAERAAWRVVPSFSSWTHGTPTGIESSEMRSGDGLKPITTLAHAEGGAEEWSADTPVRQPEGQTSSSLSTQDRPKLPSLAEATAPAVEASGSGEGSASQSLRQADRSVRAPLEALAEAERRGSKALVIVLNGSRNLLDIALNHLTLARVALYRALLEPVRPSSLDLPHATAALEGLRKAGQMDELPRALLTAALHAHLCGDAAAASRALAEAQQIAERGPMPLYLADVHLHRARLVGSSTLDIRISHWAGVDPRAELAKARALIKKHGYGRRLEELADAEAASVHW